MAQGDLTTLAAVKEWLGITTTGSDATLSRQITALSSAIRTEINRYSLIASIRTEIRDGMGTPYMVLKDWPVNSVSLVEIGSALIQPGISTQNTRTAGYFLTPYDGNPPGNAQQVELLGFNFYQGKQNVKITYNAGYGIFDEAFNVPSGSPFTYVAQSPKGTWTADGGVRYASTGVSLALVASAPTVGQYALTPNVQGGYTFAAADAGTGMLLDYSFVPPDLEQACIEWVSERNSYRTRIGVRSKSLAAQESISYDMSKVPPAVAGMIAPYASVLVVL